MNGEEYRYRGTVFLVECKEHINRVAGPGSRNYIIRGLISYGEEVFFPGSIDGDPVTSFLPFSSESHKPCYPGVKKLFIPEWLGRFIERNDVFPDLVSLEADPANRIFTTDGRMLYREGGRELSLSLSAGLKGDTVTVPLSVERIGPFAFTYSNCREIIFENKWTEAEETSFDGSKWLELQGPAVYVGNMLYLVKAGNSERVKVFIREGTERVQRNAFLIIKDGRFIRVFKPYGMKLPGLTDALTAPLRKGGRGLITAGWEDGRNEIPIPLSLALTGAELLKKTIDLGESLYDEIFMHINNGREKLDYALFAASEEGSVNEGLYRPLIIEKEEEAAERAAIILDEERLCTLIKRGFLGKGAFLRILPKLQDKGMVSAVANILISGSLGRKA